MKRSRRSFLYFAGIQSVIAPFAARALHAFQPSGQTSQPTASQSFSYFPAGQISGLVSGMKGKKDMKALVEGPPQPLLRISSEQNSVPKEFEYHEHTDHFFEVLDGKTHFDIGGTPGQQHMTKPGEWLAPVCPGSTPVELSKGDILFIPHGTPHKRTTSGEAVIKMISIFIPH